MTVGQRIRQLREQKDWTQKELAERIGVSVQAVSVWEQGRAEPDSPNRKKLCQEFGITEAQLFAGEAQARATTTEATDPMPLILEQLGYTPDDFTKLDLDDWKTIRSVLEPLVNTLIERKAKIGATRFTPQSRSVLVVEDESKLCYVISDGLRARGFDVDYVFNGEVALDRLIKGGEKPDLILLDLRMPKMGGLEFLKQLRQVNTHSRVLVISGYPEDLIESTIQSSELGIEGSFEKPFDLQELMAKVEELLR